MTVSPVGSALQEAAAFMEDVLTELLPEPVGPQMRVIEAMRYATLGGGKRFRAFLVLQSGRLFGVDRRALSRVAAEAVPHQDEPVLGFRVVRIIDQQGVLIVEHRLRLLKGDPVLSGVARRFARIPLKGEFDYLYSSNTLYLQYGNALLFFFNQAIHLSFCTRDWYMH